MNLMNSTQKVFSQFSNKTAIIDQQGEKISFGELNKMVNRLVFILHRRGIVKGEKVLVFVPVSIELYALMIALFRMGAVVVFIDPWAGSSYIDNALSKVVPNFLIYLPKVKLLTFFAKKLKLIPNQFTLDEILYEQRTIADKEDVIEDVEDDHTALITFTTGSSNNPKGFNRTHSFLLAQQRAHETYFGHHCDDVDLCMFPVFVLSNLASGMTSVLANVDLRKIEKVKPEQLIEQIDKYQVTSMTCSPALVWPLVEYFKQHSFTLPSLKKFYTGGAPVNPLLFEELAKIFPNAQMMLVYGSTEAEPIALMEATEVVQLTKSNALQGEGITLGRVVDQLDFHIIEISDNHLTEIKSVDAGKFGELILAGPFVGTNYYEDEQAFIENKIVDQSRVWHRTGDIVYEKDGVLYMVGRKHNRLQEGSRYFFPLHIEPIIDALPGIKRSAYFQWKDHKSAVLIELDGSVDKQSVMAQVEQLLMERNFHPEWVKCVKKIPLDKRHNAKIDYNKIKQLFGDDIMTISADDSVLKRFFAYTQERFPLIAILLFTALFSANTFLLTKIGFHLVDWSFNVGHYILVSLTLFLVFFHLRLLDEFKDYHDDVVAYPERLLSRGIVTLDLLGKIAFGFIFLEIVFSAALGKQALILALVVIIYSLLMFKEFFIGKILHRSMSAYLISHQLILPLMVYFAQFVAAGSGKPLLSSPHNLFIILLAVSLPSTIYEIARKTWSAERDNENADSYTRVWGVPVTSIVLTLLYLGYLLLGYFIFSSWQLNHWGLFLLGMLSFVGILTALFFLIKPTTRNSKLVELGGSLLLLGGHLAFILGVTLG